jgi:hypothetical protein
MASVTRLFAVTKKAPAPPPAPLPYVSQAKWNKPVPKINFIPAQSWLGYNWLDKDPELDRIKAAIADSGWTLEQIERETEKNGHRVSKFTLMAWMYGSTKRPQNASMNNVLAAIGWSREWVKLR